MIIKDIYSDTIPALSNMDSVQRALYFMEFFKVSRLPIIDDEIFLGMVSEESIMDLDLESFPIEKCEIQKENTFIYANQHIYDAILLMGKQKTSLLSVLDSEDKYLGTISASELINAVGKLTSIDQSGSIVVLKIGVRDYSLSEIAQIVESNQVKILSSYIQTCSDQVNIKVTLKLNTSDLSSIKAGFERYNYKIEAIFAEKHLIDDMHKDRLDELMHYINM